MLVGVLFIFLYKDWYLKRVLRFGDWKDLFIRSRRSVCVFVYLCHFETPVFFSTMSALFHQFICLSCLINSYQYLSQHNVVDQKFNTSLEKVFKNSNFRFVGENNQNSVLCEFSMVYSLNFFILKHWKFSKLPHSSRVLKYQEPWITLNSFHIFSINHP